ncbi:MAG: hypothetical protein R2704_13685 [Microthrixaceae bacterium]
MTTEVGFVDGFSQGGVIEQYVVLNPSKQNADVQPIWVTPFGQPREDIEPLEKVILRVAPKRSGSTTISGFRPKGFITVGGLRRRGWRPLRVLVTTAERGDSEDSGTQVRPAPATGASISPGLPLAADRWWAGGIRLSGDDEGWLLLDNPSSSETASIKLLVHGDGEWPPPRVWTTSRWSRGPSWR